LKHSERDVSRFHDEARSGMDASVKDFASRTLPEEKQHLAAAEALSRTGNQ